MLCVNGNRPRNKDGYTCSGCGYDKESTVIAQIFNEFLKYKLYDETLRSKWMAKNNFYKDEDSKPYGVHLPGEYTPYYDGGIGTNCYYRIAEYIGGVFEHVASGKMFDVYRYTDNESEESSGE